MHWWYAFGFDDITHLQSYSITCSSKKRKYVNLCSNTEKYHNTRLFYPPLVATFVDRLFSTHNNWDCCCVYCTHRGNTVCYCKRKMQEIKQGPPFYVVMLTKTKYHKYKYNITYNYNITWIPVSRCCWIYWWSFLSLFFCCIL